MGTKSTISVAKPVRKSLMNHQESLSRDRRGKDGKGKSWWNGD